MQSGSSFLNNKHAYSLNELLDLILLANHYIDFKTSLFFEKLECNFNEISFITNTILPIMADRKHVNKTYQSFFNQSLEAKIPQIDDALAHYQDDSQSKPKVGITSVTWFISLIEGFKHGNILNRDNLKVIAAHHLFFHELLTLLKMMYENQILKNEAPEDNKYEFSKKLTLEKYALRHALITFIADLIKINEVKSAATIHNFLYLCNKIILSKGNMSAFAVASSIASSLKYGLEFHEGFQLPAEFINDPETNDEFISQFFQIFALYCLDDPVFKQPFSTTLDAYKAPHEHNDLSAVKEAYIQKLWAPKTIDWTVTLPNNRGENCLEEISASLEEQNAEQEAILYEESLKAIENALVEPNLVNALPTELQQYETESITTTSQRKRGNTSCAESKRLSDTKDHHETLTESSNLSDSRTESSLSNESNVHSDKMEIDSKEKILAILGNEYLEHLVRNGMKSKRKRSNTDRERRPCSWNTSEPHTGTQNEELKKPVALTPSFESKKPSTLLNAFQNLRLKRHQSNKVHKRGISK